MNLSSQFCFCLIKEEETYIHVIPIPKNELAITGEIQCVLFEVQANQNRQTGNKNAPTKDIGNLASGLILPPASLNFCSK